MRHRMSLRTLSDLPALTPDFSLVSIFVLISSILVSYSILPLILNEGMPKGSYRPQRNEDDCGYSMLQC